MLNLNQNSNNFLYTRNTFKAEVNLSSADSHSPLLALLSQ